MQFSPVFPFYCFWKQAKGCPYRKDIMIQNNSKNTEDNMTHLQTVPEFTAYFCQFPFYPYQNDFPTQMFDSVVKQCENLKEQVRRLNKEIDMLQAELSEVKTQKLDSNIEDQSIIEANLSESPSKIKKAYPKDKLCPIRGCYRKYSSKIALKAHFKKKHPRSKRETEEFYP